MGWQKVKVILINGKIPLSIYRSNKSKLHVFVAETPGPIVDGRITFVTETHSDDGALHALEHLVFMGSEYYPHKGILDIIANRCLATGANAITEQDKTTFELSTAGSTGFLKVLPVFLTHLLEPDLKPSQYMTEVHHVNGVGMDGGVVYCERQETVSMETMMSQKRRELAYGEGSSYAACTGGKPYDISHCTLEKVIECHDKFYHLANLYITVCGQIGNHNELLSVIESVEARSVMYSPVHFEQPFQAAIFPLNWSETKKIVCPSVDELGMVEMSWRGPKLRDIHTCRALRILWIYIKDAVLNDFTRTEDTFCTSVDLHIVEQQDCEIVASFQGVPISKLDSIRQRFFEKTVADHRELGAFDVQRIGTIIDEHKQFFDLSIENSAPKLIGGAIVEHQIYGRESDPNYDILNLSLNETYLWLDLKLRPADYWHSLFRHFIEMPNCVCVAGEPSSRLVKELAEKETERIKRRIAHIGVNGLALCEQELENAIEVNKFRHPPDDALNELIVHDLEEFKMIDVDTSTNLHFPFTAFLHRIRSNFVEANILIDTSSVPIQDRHFLMLWLEVMLQSPAFVDGREISHEEVAEQAARDLVSNSASIGISGEYDQFLSLRLRAYPDKVENLLKWAEIYLKGIKFYPDRVALCARNLANDAAKSKQDVTSVCDFLIANSTHSKESNTRFYSCLALEKYHRAVAEAVEDEDDRKWEAVLARLELVRQKTLEAPLNVHFCGDMSQIQHEWLSAGVATQWEFIGRQKRALLQCSTNHGVSMEQYGKSFAIPFVGVGHVAFLYQTTRFDDAWTGQTTMPTLLLVKYLSQMGGPLWHAVRGDGLAYGIRIRLLPDSKALTLELERCSNLGQAYERSRDTVRSILNGKLDENFLEAAKRSLVSELISTHSTVELTATVAILATIRSVDKAFTVELCKKIWHATAENVLTIGGPALRRLFDSSTSVRSIVLNPSRHKELNDFPGTKKLEFSNFQVKPNI